MYHSLGSYYTLSYNISSVSLNMTANLTQEYRYFDLTIATKMFYKTYSPHTGERYCYLCFMSCGCLE